MLGVALLSLVISASLKVDVDRRGKSNRFHDEEQHAFGERGGLVPARLAGGNVERMARCEALAPSVEVELQRTFEHHCGVTLAAPIGFHELIGEFQQTHARAVALRDFEACAGCGGEPFQLVEIDLCVHGARWLPVIASGRTHRSKSSAVRYPERTAASRSVVPSRCAVFAISAAWS